MGRLTLFERIRIVKLYNDLEVGHKNKYTVISNLALSNYGIELSAKRVIIFIEKRVKSRRLGDQLRYNKSKLFQTLVCKQ